MQLNSLLVISDELALVKTREDMGPIFCKLSVLLGFFHSTLFVLNNDSGHMSDLLADYQLGSPFFREIELGKNSLDLDDEILQETLPYLRPGAECNFTRGLILNLNKGSEIIGSWVILYGSINGTDGQDPASLRLLGNAINLAVLTVLANEQVRNGKQENDIIQSINGDLSATREKTELLGIIHSKLKHLFDFGHHFVAIINDDDMTATSFLRDSESRSKNHPDYDRVNVTRFPITDGVFNKVLMSNDPLVFELEKMLAKGDIPYYLQINYESGIRKVVMMVLQVRGKTIGIWAICQLKGQDISPHQLDLIKSIANQFSIAVANIIAGEVVAARELENERLLWLSQGLTKVRSRDDLQKAIQIMLKGIIDFQEIVIMLLNGQTTYYRFLIATCSQQPATRLNEEYNGNFCVGDNCFGEVINTDDITFLSMEALIRKDDSPFYINKEFERGIRHKVGVPICDENSKVGVLFINTAQKESYSNHHLKLIKSISYQLSTAILNIIANEMVIKREAELDVLILLSNHIAAVRNNQELLAVISTDLQNILGFRHTIIARIAESGGTASGFLLDPKAASRDHPLYRQAVHGEFPIGDGILDLAVDAEVPLVFNLEELALQRELPLYLRVNYESGCRQIVVIRFTENARAFGFWIVFFDHNDTLAPSLLRMVVGIANQLSIALQNIIANQKIRQQLEEINGYKSRLEEEKMYLQEEIHTTRNYADIIGKSTELQKVFRLVAQVAPSDSTVMILGETGTGKELIARAIHDNSPRRGKLMVKVNCAALPANLIESELFGHERGSFTGAIERRVGKFELAHNGTLFLDEIGEMPLELQVKLLRALQEREIERIGGRTAIKVDVRIIAATNRDLEQEVKEGRFRIDLYFRLNIFPIHLPPLRHRVEDIPLLASHFISRFSKKTGRKINTLSNRALQELGQYSWPGNIRELEHIIERSILLSSGDALTHIALPAATSIVTLQNNRDEYSLKTIDDNERDHILRALKFCSGKVDGKGGAAEILGVPASTLHSKMKKLNIRKEHVQQKV
jgi:formate hydrogenlyase transcriptional activator